MKRFKITGLVTFIAVIISVAGCYYDKYPAIEGVSRDVSFVDDIVPIFNASCNSAGCHSTGGIGPDLTAGVGYRALNNGGYINLEAPENSSLYRSMTGETSLMPPTGKLADTELSLVLGWIAQGALDN